MGPNEPENTTPSAAPESPVTPEQSTEPVSEAVPTSEPVVSDAQPAAPVPPTETPNSAVTPDTASPQLPVKKSKKGLIIGAVVAAVVLVGLVAGGLVYALVYNNPDNAVIDAFSKAIAAKSGSTTGTVSIKSQDTSVKMDLSGASNQSQQSSADTTITITTGGKDYTLKGHFAATKDEVYVKLDDLRSVITGALGSEYSSMIETYYGGILDKIDGKWVVIKQSDLEELSSGSVSNKESQCIQDEAMKLQTDASLRNELTDVYKKHPLFTVTSKGSDSDGNRYNLAPVDNAKAKEFMNAVVETKFFKAMDDCTSSDLKKEFTDNVSSEESSDKSTGSLDVWVDGWSHNLNKISLNVKDDDTEVTGEFKMKFNNNPSVTIPKGETTVDDLKTEIQKIQQEMLSAYSSSSAYDYTY